MRGLKAGVAALMLAASLAGAAAGEPRGHGDRGGPHGWAGRGAPAWSHGGGGGEGRWGGGPPDWSHAGGRWQGGGQPGRWQAQPPPEPRGRWDGPSRAPYGYAPPPFMEPRQPGPGYPLRRGGRVPPQAWSNVIPDYGRHRLRPPPPGYSWVLMGDRYMLVSRRTGQIFDVIGR